MMKRLKTTTHPKIITGIFIALLLPSWADGDPLEIQDGITHYQKQEYAEAEQSFQNASKKHPENSKLAYNLANSKYKSGKYEEALGSYAKSMSDDNLKHPSLYNTGNALFRMGMLEEAASAYKKALEINPNDMDTKFNLEFTKEQIRKKQQKESGQSNQDQDTQGQDKKSNSQDQAKGKGQQHDPNNKNGNEPSNNSQQQPKPDKPSPETPRDESETSHTANLPGMGKEEAEQWLRAVNENPRKFAQRQIQDNLKKEKTPVGNDW